MAPRPLLALSLVFAAACGGSQRAPTPSATPASATAATPADRFDHFAHDYFDARFQYVPTEATSTGVHTHDDALDDLSPAGIDRFVRFLTAQRDALDALIPQLPATRENAPAGGSDHPLLDAQLLRDAIELERLRIAEWHEYQTRPSAFHQLAADTVYQLMARDFAPLDERVRHATARLRAVPALLREGEATIGAPSPLSVDVALREIGGSIEMVRDVFPAFAARAHDPATVSAARSAAAAATAALEQHARFLRETVLPRATGDYHDGRARWTVRARLGEGATETPEQIRDASLAEVRRLQAEMRTLAQRISPHEELAPVLARLRHDHPTADALLDAYRARQDAVRAFVRARDLVTIDPARDDLSIEATPLFLRATIFAALSAPGALEQRDRHTLFYVTPADTTRPPAEIDGYLSEHSNPAIAVTSIHEAYPGHHVQGIHQRQAHSFVRQLLWQGSYGEGWAHYVEQMMVDQGFGDDAIRLDQRQEALLRAARAYLDVGVHVFGMSYEDAVRFYRDEVFMSQPGAEMEARRVCLNPATVFVYTYGKFAFYRLRDAVLARTPHPTLTQFHNAVLDFGSAPLPALARALYGMELPPWTPGQTPSIVAAGENTAPSAPRFAAQ